MTVGCATIEGYTIERYTDEIAMTRGGIADEAAGESQDAFGETKRKVGEVENIGKASKKSGNIGQ